MHLTPKKSSVHVKVHSLNLALRKMLRILHLKEYLQHCFGRDVYFCKHISLVGAEGEWLAWEQGCVCDGCNVQ